MSLCDRNIVSSFRLIEQGMHKKNLIYSTRKVFLEKTVVELVYKLDEGSYHKFLKGVCQSLKYDSIFLVNKHKYISENAVAISL